MKNTMKKIMSLVLVAMILVSAIPFSASAARTDGNYDLSINVVDSNGNLAHGETYGAPNGSVNVVDCLAVANNQSGTSISADRILSVTVDGTAHTGNSFSLSKDGLQVVITVSAANPPAAPAAPAPAKLVIKLGEAVKYETTGTPGIAMDTATCLPYTGISAADVDYVTVNGVRLGGTSFNLGESNSTTTVVFVKKQPVQVAYLKVFVNGAEKYNVVGTPNSTQSVNESASCGGIDTSKVKVTAISVDDSHGNTQNVAMGGTFTMGAAGSTTNVRFTTTPISNTTNNNNNTTNNNNNGNSYNVNNGTVTNQATGYTKFAYPVYLNIYTDTTVGSAKKTINITSGIAADGRVTLGEVKSLVFNYYKSNSSAGIQFDGLYPAQGNWVYNYVADQKYDTLEGLYDAAANNYVYINVMISNATAINNTNNSTNPKTGDEIYKAVTVMAISASALALCFYFNKKRAIQ